MVRSSGRRSAEWLVIFAAAIVFLRALALEPYGVPTGSMAPELTGNHHQCVCDRCGHTFAVAEPVQAAHGPANVSCPNCGLPGIPVGVFPELSGDRLLVDKIVYELRTPRRWEVAVFRCPSDLSKPYVKRVAGLPGETVQLAAGDLYINNTIARKNLAQAREVRQLIHTYAETPQPGGWGLRWLADPPPVAGETPLVAFGEHAIALRGSALNTPAWATYQNYLFDEQKTDALRDGFVYNGPFGGNASQTAHDFAVECDVAAAGPGRFLCRINDGSGDEVVAAVGIGPGEHSSLRVGKVDAIGLTPSFLEPGKKFKFEMFFFDRRVIVAVDGRELFPAYDVSVPEIREPVVRPIQVGADRTDLDVSGLQIYRDIHYRASGDNGCQYPYRLGEREYFMLGDNTANSDDSRSWPIAAVPEHYFLGHPFLIHQPSRQAEWSLFGRKFRHQSIDWGRIRWVR